MLAGVDPKLSKRSFAKASESSMNQPVDVELHHETFFLKLANCSSCPSHAVLLRHGTLLGEWNCSEKVVYLRESNLIW